MKITSPVDRALAEIYAAWLVGSLTDLEYLRYRLKIVIELIDQELVNQAAKNPIS